MAATVNTVAIRAQTLAKLQQICQGFTYNLEAFDAMMSFISANGLTFTNDQTDPLSFVDNGSTGTGSNNGNDFTAVAPQMTTASLSALLTNMEAGVGSLSLTTIAEIAAMAGKPMV